MAQNYTNFSRFLSANRDTAERDANRLADGIEADGLAVERDLAQEQAGFADAVRAGTPQGGGRYNPNARGPRPEAPQYAGPTSQAGYSGDRWGALEGRAQGVQDRANAASVGPYGLQGLMHGSAFDAGLVGSVGGGRFSALGDRFRGLSGRLRAAGESGAQQVTTAQQSIAAPTPYTKDEAEEMVQNSQSPSGPKKVKAGNFRKAGYV